MSAYEPHQYRAYSPDVNPQSTRHRGQAPVIPEPDDYRRGSNPTYPPPGVNPVADYHRLTLLNDHGDDVTVGLNNHGAPPPSYTPYSGSYNSDYQNLAPLDYDQSLHRVASSPGATGVHNSLYPEISNVSRRSISSNLPDHSISANTIPDTSSSHRHLSGAFPTSAPPAQRSRSRHSTPSDRSSPSPDHSPSRARVRSSGRPAPPPGPFRNFSDLMSPANVATAANAVASFFSSATTKPPSDQPHAPTSSSPPPANGLNFNMKDIYDYLRPPPMEAPSAPSGSAPTLQLGNFSLDLNWIMQFVSQSNPLVLAGGALVLFLVISQIIATIMKVLFMGVIAYGIFLFAMSNQQQSGSAHMPLKKDRERERERNPWRKNDDGRPSARW